jgi:hypothetical protein
VVDERFVVPLANYIALYAALFGLGAVCAAKGKFRFLVLGLVFPIFWIVGAVRPAKPHSVWARVRTTYFDSRTANDTWQ